MRYVRKTLRALLATLPLLALPVIAQVPVGYVQVTGNYVGGQTSPVANGTIYFQPVNNSGAAIGYRIGQGYGAIVNAAISGGSVTGCSVAGAGIGYTAGATALISTALGSGAVITLGTGTGGAITSCTVTAGGSGYGTGAAPAVTVVGYGQATQNTLQAQVTNGVFSLLVPDTALTSPVNVCFNVTVIDNVSGNSILGPGYGCVQPASSGVAVTGTQPWCAAGSTSQGGTCNFDAYTPNLSAQITSQAWPTAALSIGTVTSVPAGTPPSASISGTAPNQSLNLSLEQGITGATGAIGPTGPAPTISAVNVALGSSLGGTWSGCPSACVLNLTITSGTNYRGNFLASTAYAVGDIVTNAGSIYICPTAFTSGASFNSANWNAFPTSGGSSLPTATAANQLLVLPTSGSNIPLNVTPTASGTPVPPTNAVDIKVQSGVAVPGLYSSVEVFDNSIGAGYGATSCSATGSGLVLNINAPNGIVTGATITTGGAGIFAGEPFSIIQNGQASATYTVSTVSGGAATAGSVTAGGFGYTSATNAATAPGTCYALRIAAVLGTTLNNHSVSANEACDDNKAVFNDDNYGAGSTVFTVLGNFVNDADLKGVGLNEIIAEDCMAGAIAQEMIPSTYKYTPSSFGTLPANYTIDSSTFAANAGLETTTNGAVSVWPYTTTVAGQSVVVLALVKDGNGGTFSVADSGGAPTLQENAFEPQAIATANGATYAVKAIYMPNINRAAGTYNITVTATSATSASNIVEIFSVAPVPPVGSANNLWVIGTPRQYLDQKQYATWEYDQDERFVINQAQQQGLAPNYANVRNYWFGTPSEMATGSLQSKHPNDLGHWEEANSVLSATSSPIYTDLTNPHTLNTMIRTDSSANPTVNVMDKEVNIGTQTANGVITLPAVPSATASGNTVLIRNFNTSYSFTFTAAQGAVLLAPLNTIVLAPNQAVLLSQSYSLSTGAEWSLVSQTPADPTYVPSISNGTTTLTCFNQTLYNNGSSVVMTVPNTCPAGKGYWIKNYGTSNITFTGPTSGDLTSQTLYAGDSLYAQQFSTGAWYAFAVSRQSSLPSCTQTFTAAAGLTIAPRTCYVQRATLTTNVTSFTLSSGADGQSMCLDIVQGASVYTVVTPSNLVGWKGVSQTANGEKNQCFTYSAAATKWFPSTPSDTQGSATLSSGTSTVSTTAACTPGAVCSYRLTNCGANASTAIGTLSVGTVTPGTSFVINSLTSAAAVATGDASCVNWAITN